MGGLKFVVLLIICFIPVIVEIKTAADSNSWVTTAGVVVNYTDRKSPTIDHWAPSVSALAPESAITFKYKVNDQTMDGLYASLPHAQIFSELPTDLAKEYPPGTSVTVKYSQDDPKKAIIPSASQAYITIAIVEGFAGACLGALIALVATIINPR